MDRGGRDMGRRGGGYWGRGGGVAGAGGRDSGGARPRDRGGGGVGRYGRGAERERGGRGRGNDGGDRRGGGGRGRGHRREERTPRPVGAGLVKEKCSDLLPQELLMWLLADRGFKVLLEQPRIDNPGTLLEVLKAINKAMETGRSENGSELLINFRDSSYFQSISQHINAADPSSSYLTFRIVEQLLPLLDTYMDCLPSDSVDIVSLNITVMESKNDIISNLSGTSEDILINIKQKVDLVRNRRSLKKDDEGRKNIKTKTSDQDIEPPEEFRTISIFPTRDDFEGNEIFLRKNIVGESYKNLNTYLDIQFRLYREDFIRPLREGILEYKHCLQTGQKIQNRDVRIYKDTRIMFPDISLNGLTYQLQFSLDGFRNMRWENSKRLIYGSLVCLSSDGFNSFVFATVANREPEKLQHGIIDVYIESEENINFQEQYVMVESSSYFESCRHVLKSLQEIGDKLPFQKYIIGEVDKREDDVFVDAEKKPKSEVIISAPRYLTHEVHYDLTPLMNKGAEKLGENVLVRNTKNWPNLDYMALDKSQFAAVKSALTKEVAIVQGPPGTGKTYIGLKIAEVLLLNSKWWKSRRGQGPILVLCYTNHALDQFLEGILKFNDEIVRVGSRSKNSALENYNISNLRRNKGELPRDIRTNFFDVKQKLNLYEEKITDINVRIEATRKHLFSENELERFMGEAADELRSKIIDFAKRPKSFIQEWLGLGSTAENGLDDIADNMEDLQVDQDQDPAGNEQIEAEMIEVVEDAEREHEIRFVDLEGDHDNKDVLKELKEKKDRAFGNIGLINYEDVPDENQNIGGWSLTKNELKRRRKKVPKELSKDSTMNPRERLAAESNPWRLTLNDRWKLYRTWIQDYKTYLQQEHDSVKDKYLREGRRLKELKEIEMTHILQKAKVVGMTTTGASRLHSVVKNINSSIMIVEEAAEVFEAHIVASITESCKHLILIGDHQQLRPNPTVYELCRKYNLDVSLFERLIKNGLDHNRLDIQHRMLPAISKLIVPHIYKDLLDHESVKHYPQIKGVCSNLFFIDHAQRETKVVEGKSKVNDHEVDFLIELCRYFLKQGYKSEKISILSTYSGQLFAFKKKMPKQEFQGVKVTTVDNYQGEENDIILLSLVRSNLEGSIGFLSIDNRVCVALSRAKHALYCIGNFVQLAEKSPLWRNIVTYLHGQKMIDDGLTLKSSCQHQVQTKYEKKVSCGKDIRENFPEGGCNQPCTARLPCGHTCQLSCHSYDERHEKYLCMKTCGRVREGCEYGHKCTRICHQDCGPCPDKVQKIIPRCGHSQMVRCSLDPEKFFCRKFCEKTRDCGHKCTLLCGADCSDATSPATRCTVPVEISLPCGHTEMIQCFEANLSRKPPCKVKCSTVLGCGHPCQGTCHECDGVRLHKKCDKICDRPLVCGHTCKEKCGLPCYCSERCGTRCGHSQCQLVCAEPCAPCQEPCLRRCPHKVCNLLCSEPCMEDPCDEPCHNILPCGHDCIGLCGDPCPTVCRTCHKDSDTFEIFFGDEEDEDARFVQLIDCGHCIHADSMDGWAKMNQSSENGNQSVKLVECPKCKTSVRSTLRYNGITNKELANVEAVKAKFRGENDPKLRNDILRSIRDDVNNELKSKCKEGKNIYSTEDVKGWVQEFNSYMEPGKLVTIHHVKSLKQISSFLLKFLRHLKSLYRIPSQKSTLGIKEWKEDYIHSLERVQTLCSKSCRTGTLLTNQQLEEINNESTRLENYLHLIKFCAENESQGKTFKPKTIETKEEEFKQLNVKLKKSCTGLGVSEAERKEIIQATGLGRGHWYMCPNGHPYAIGECGGAMQMSKCPEPGCGATIGGSSHRLANDNRAAHEMDGSNRQHYLWGLPDGNN